MMTIGRGAPIRVIGVAADQNSGIATPLLAQ
jgi:hypothetical protein